MSKQVPHRVGRGGRRNLVRVAQTCHRLLMISVDVGFVVSLSPF